MVILSMIKHDHFLIQNKKCHKDYYYFCMEAFQKGGEKYTACNMHLQIGGKGFLAIYSLQQKMGVTYLVRHLLIEIQRIFLGELNLKR